MWSKRNFSGSVMHTASTPLQMSRPAPVMKVLVPLITHSSPSRTARVRMRPLSEPASGSVMPIAVLASPRSTGCTMVSIQRAFCPGVPSVATGWAKESEANSDQASARSTLPISSSTRQKLRMSVSVPPTSSGISMPMKPSSPMRLNSAVSKRAAASRSATPGATSLRANSWAVLRMASCSSVYSNMCCSRWRMAAARGR